MHPGRADLQSRLMTTNDALAKGSRPLDLAVFIDPHEKPTIHRHRQRRGSLMRAEMKSIITAGVFLSPEASKSAQFEGAVIRHHHRHARQAALDDVAPVTLLPVDRLPAIARSMGVSRLAIPCAQMRVRTTAMKYADDEHKGKIPPAGQRSQVRRVSPVTQRSPIGRREKCNPLHKGQG